MTVDIVWWDLAGSGPTIESLQEDLRESVEPWQDVEGLRLKLWIADREHDRWGAIMWWEPDRPADRPLPPNRAAELIGAPPTHRARFEVAAVAEGIHSHRSHCPFPTTLSGVTRARLRSRRRLRPSAP